MTPYPTREELLTRLSNREDNFVERKLESVKDEELRRTIVTFANSIPEPRMAVAFFGVHNDGAIQGVANPDKLQKRIRDICDNVCYPPVNVKMEVLEKDNKSIIAVIIPPSDDRPHFSGPAFCRKGSQSLKTSKELFDEIVACRNSKTYAILKWKDKDVTVVTDDIIDKGSNYYDYFHKVEGCTAHCVQLFEPTTGQSKSIPLEHLDLAFDTKRANRLKIIIKAQKNPKGR